MSDCGCEKAKRDLEEYLHNELEGSDAEDIRNHLEWCTECADEHHVGKVLTDAVQRACRETAPETLREQVIARLREIQASH